MRSLRAPLRSSGLLFTVATLCAIQLSACCALGVRNAAEREVAERQRHRADRTTDAATDHPDTSHDPGAASVTDTPASKPSPPVAKRVPHELTTHGHTRNDEYYWLRSDKRDDPEVIAYLDAENAYKTAVMSHTEGLQTELFDEIVGRIDKDDSTVPYLLDGWWYYKRFGQGLEHPVHARKRGTLDAPEEIVLDTNIEAAKHDYYKVGAAQMSRDHDLLAFAEDTLSRRIYTVRFKRLSTGELLEDRLEGGAGAIAWAADNKTLFYVKREEGTLRAYQVWRHTLGTAQAADTLVYEEKDDTYWVTVHRTRSRDFIVMHSESTLATEVRVVPAATPTSAPQLFHARQKDHEYSVDHGGGDRWYVRTNDNAKNFRLMSTRLRDAGDRAGWQEVIDARETVFLIAFELFDDFLVVNERVAGLRSLRIIPWKTPGDAHTLTFDEPAYVASLGVNVDVSSKVLRFDYESLTTPGSVYDYDMVSRQRTLMKRDRVLGDFDPADYVAERFDVVARDGTKIPVSMVHRKDLDRAVPQPVYEYGYGAYGYSMDPWFSVPRLSLLDRGFIHVIAHIRGGQEMGRAWYEDGKLLKKRNTFTDFIDVGRHLVETGVTSPDKLIASGGSAGGLLVGAVANMAPDLYDVVIANVPFVDVVTTMLDETIPLTTFEYDEWGNPNDKPYYDYILTYSPYDNIKAGASYPDLLVITGLHDSQVQYWEPAKWVARLRAMDTGDGLIALHTNMETGHGGASGRFARYKETALQYAFVIDRIRTQ